jgi:hypothetical protein
MVIHFLVTRYKAWGIQQIFQLLSLYHAGCKMGSPDGKHSGAGTAVGMTGGSVVAPPHPASQHDDGQQANELR